MFVVVAVEVVVDIVFVVVVVGQIKMIPS